MNGKQRFPATIAFKCSNEMRHELERIAEAEDRSLGQVMRRLLEKTLGKPDQERGAA